MQNALSAPTAPRLTTSPIFNGHSKTESDQKQNLKY